jgi:hypothetical protein
MATKNSTYVEAFGLKAYGLTVWSQFYESFSAKVLCKPFMFKIYTLKSNITVVNLSYVHLGCST